MATSGPVFASTVTAVAGTWTSATNATGTNNNVYATWSHSTRRDTATLRLGGFGTFSDIPAGSTISAIDVSAWCFVSNTSNITPVTGSVGVSGTALQPATTLTMTTANAARAFNIQTIAGTMPQLSDLQANNLTVDLVFTGANNTTAATASVDAVSVTVTYTVPTPVQWDVSGVVGGLSAATGTAGQITAPMQTVYRAWPSTSGPSTASTNDSQGTGLGVEFTVDSAATFSGWYFWQSTVANSGVSCALYQMTSATTGTLLTSVTNQTMSATQSWNYVPSSAGIALTPGTHYRAVVWKASPGISYTASSGSFASDIVNGPLRVYSAANALGGLQGSYVYSSTLAVTNSQFNNGNYWVDLEVTTAAGPSSLAVSGTAMGISSASGTASGGSVVSTPPTVAQTAGNSATGTTISATLPAAPTTGNTVLAFVNSNNTFTVTAGGSRRFTYLGDQQVDVWEYTGTLPQTVTVTPSAADYVAITLVELSGVSGFDLVGTGTSSSNPGQTSATASSITTSAVNDLVLAFVALHGQSNPISPTSPVWNNGFTVAATLLQSGPAASSALVGQFIGQKALTSAGAVGGTTVTWTNPAENTDTVMLAYKGGGGGGGGTGLSLTAPPITARASVPVPVLNVSTVTSGAGAITAAASMPVPTLSIQQVLAVSGTAAGTSAATGSAAARLGVSGSVAGTSTAVGSSTPPLAASGLVAASSTVLGTVGQRQAVSGSVASVSTATGIVTPPGTSGLAIGISAASGNISARMGVSGSSVATSSDTGDAPAIHPLSGVSSGFSTSAGSASQLVSVSVQETSETFSSGTVTELIAVSGSVAAISGSVGGTVGNEDLLGIAASSSDAFGEIAVLHSASGRTDALTTATGDAQWQHRVPRDLQILATTVAVSGWSAAPAKSGWNATTASNKNPIVLTPPASGWSTTVPSH